MNVAMPGAPKMGSFIVGLGGAIRSGSSSEKALRFALKAAEASGARTELFVGQDIDMPMYAPERVERCSNAQRLVEALRRCDGVIIASPGYHGSFSGLVKNALDYTEDMAGDERVYLEGLPVGLIASAAGPQAAAGTLAGLRSVVHALRGWPTPLGVAINSAEVKFDTEGSPLHAQTAAQLEAMAEQVVVGAHARALVSAFRSVARP